MPLLAMSQETPKDSAVFIELNFALDSYSLSNKEKARVDSILEEVPVAVLKHVVIYGHTDSLASLDYNRVLSRRRVESILRYLVYRGLDPLLVKTGHYGEERPRYSNSPEERARNRRVELYLVIDPALLPEPNVKLTDLPFAKGDRVRIPNLNFIGNQPIPVPESFEVLQELVKVMEKYPDLKIELQGHVCCSNDLELSVARARMVYDFLVGNGIAPSRLKYDGFSNTRPLFKERTDKEKALNRRVEIQVLSNTGRSHNTREELPKIDLRAPIFNVSFFPAKNRLYPSADFMLSLIAESMRTSQGLNYEFVVYDNINNPGLTKARAGNLERVLVGMDVDKNIFNVITEPKAKGMLPSDNQNVLVVKITQK